MMNLQNKNDREKLVIYTMLKDLDAGKAIVAAIVVGVIGCFAAILTKLYMFAYWGAYFEFYNIPFSYFNNTEVFTSNIYAILISVLISFLYFFILTRYYKKLLGYKKERKRYSFIDGKLMQFVMLILVPGLCASMVVFYIMLLTDGGFGYIGFMVCISTLVLTVLTTVIFGFYTMRASCESKKIKKSMAYSAKNIMPISAMIVTVLIFSLAVVYLFGYFQTVIDLDIPQSISIDGEENDIDYVLLLNMKDSYFCAPVEFKNGDIMELKNNSYRIIPKETSVTIYQSDAWAVNSEYGKLWLSDIIKGDEGIFGLTMLSCVVVMILLLFLESRCLVFQSENEEQ